MLSERMNQKKKAQQAIAANGDLLRDELHRLRGRNLLRAKSISVPRDNRLYLYEETRGQVPNHAYWVVEVTEKLDDIRAIRFPSGEIIMVRDGQLSEFMESLAANVRQKSYLRTHPDKTTYRAQKASTERPSEHS